MYVYAISVSLDVRLRVITYTVYVLFEFNKTKLYYWLRNDVVDSVVNNSSSALHRIYSFITRYHKFALTCFDIYFWKLKTSQTMIFLWHYIALLYTYSNWSISVCYCISLIILTLAIEHDAILFLFTILARYSILCKMCIIDYHQGFAISTIHTNNNCRYCRYLKNEKLPCQYFWVLEIPISCIISPINHKSILLFII